MLKADPIVTFRTGCAGTRQIIALSGSMDALTVDEPYSRLYMFNEKIPSWNFNEHPFVVPAMCVWQSLSKAGPRFFMALNENGQLVTLGARTSYENIADAGLSRPGAAGYGYLMGLRQVGTALYTCGFGGQVLRRDEVSGWQHMDVGLLQPPGTTQGGYVVQAIDGHAENAIYVAGALNERGLPPRVDFFDGRGWSRLDLPRDSSRITCILVESRDRIWLGGDSGTLLCGNAVDGFSSRGPVGEHKFISSVAVFQGKGYVATNLGLFTFDPTGSKGGLVGVRTGLQPELQDANIVQAVDGVLWSLGIKDLARFDGANWERVQHPDNPPISSNDAASQVMWRDSRRNKFH